MSVGLDAEWLGKHLQQYQARLLRMKENCAYKDREEQIAALLKWTAGYLKSLKTFSYEIEELEMMDPSHSLQRQRWSDVSYSIASTQYDVEEKILQPMLTLVEEIEGAPAKARAADPKKLVLLPTRQRWSVVVGIEQYGPAGLHDLPTSRADAEAMGKLLASDHRYKDQPESVALLVNYNACREKVLAAVRKSAACAGKEDMLLFFFSGHGDLVNGQPVLIPYDYSKEEPSASALPVGEVIEAMKASSAGTRVIIIDSCHSGPDIAMGGEQAKGQVEEMAMKPDFIERVFDQARGSAVMTGCTASQLSWSYPSMGLSCFTYFLVEALKGKADFDNKGFVTISDAFHYVRYQVGAWGEQHFHEQTPALSYTVTGEIVLMDYRKAAEN